jgi:glutathione S-transferase
MAKLTLYYAPGTCSLTQHIALEEAGAAFEARPMSLKKGDQRKPEFLALNPKGKVPLLLIDGKPLTENVAISHYLAKTFPDARLLPSGNAMAEAEGISMLAWCAAGVHTGMSPLFGPQRVCDLPDSEASVKRLAAENTAKNFAMIEKILAGKEWALGQWSIVDAYFFVFWRWANFHQLALDAYPNYAKHFARMSERPSVKRALAREAEDQTILDKAA